jgi:hypothetical protein
MSRMERVYIPAEIKIYEETTNILVLGKIIAERASENAFTIMVTFMSANGKMGRDMVLATTSFEKETGTEVIGKRT